MIVDPDGYIVTNAHVVNDAQRVRVDIRLPVAGDSSLATRSRTVNASIVGIDLETDLAVIKVDERNLATLPFGNSDDLRAGQLVLAFGRPLGLENSVSLTTFWLTRDERACMDTGLALASKCAPAVARASRRPLSDTAELRALPLRIVQKLCKVASKPATNIDVYWVTSTCIRWREVVE